MAVIPVVPTRKGDWLIFTWETVTDSDTCAPAYINHNISDAFVQVTGTFSSASISMTGGVTSSLGVADVPDPGGTAIAVTAAGGSAIRDIWPYMAPATVSGSSSDVDVVVQMKIVK